MVEFPQAFLYGEVKERLLVKHIKFTHNMCLLSKPWSNTVQQMFKYVNLNAGEITLVCSDYKTLLFFFVIRSFFYAMTSFACGL